MGNDFTVGFKANTLVQPAVGDQAFTVTVPAANLFATVISHDCEFNEGKRNKLLVARLQKMQGNLTPEQREDLRASNDVLAQSAAKKHVSGVDGFVFAPLPGFFDEEQVASFTTITALPMKMHDDLYSQKRAELTQQTRVLFRGKLAWFVGRSAEDIPDEEKIDPPAHHDADEAAEPTAPIDS
jgi:hypothetical protein